MEGNEEGPLKVYSVEHRPGMVAIRLARQGDRGLELLAAGDFGSILLTPDDAANLGSDLQFHAGEAVKAARTESES